MKALGGFAAALLAGCGIASHEIPGEYVSPARYSLYSCEQLASESNRLKARASELAGVVDSRAQANPHQMNSLAVWPEYARVQGEHRALQKAAEGRQCALVGPARLPPSVPATKEAP